MEKFYLEIHNYFDVLDFPSPDLSTRTLIIIVLHFACKLRSLNLIVFYFFSE